MNTSQLSRSLLLATACAFTPLMLAPVAFAAPAPTMVVAQAQTLQSTVTDTAGVLSASEVTDLESKVHDLMLEHQVKMYIVFEPTFNGLTGSEAAQEIFDSNRGENVVVFAVATEDRKMGSTAADYQQLSHVDAAIKDAAFSHLVDNDWAGAAFAAVDAVDGAVSGGSSRHGGGAGAGGSSDSGSGALWLGAAGLAAGGTVVGGVALAKKSKKRREEEQREAAAALDRSNPNELMYADLAALEEMAHDELVTTDEAIRGAEEELHLATGEFGAERTAAFARRIEQAKKMHARFLQQMAQLPGNAPEQARRSLFTDVVSHCHTTDQQLAQQAEEFTDMRNLLIGAPERLNTLTQKSVDASARLQQAQTLLEGLHQRFSDEALASIQDNPTLAAEHLAQADKAIDEGRRLAALPAGQQGSLVTYIRTAENALNQADLLLSGIEHADTNITTARTQLPALMAEVEQEINMVPQLTSAATQEQSDALIAAAAEGKKAVELAREVSATDPLRAFNALSAADVKLDAAIDSVKARAEAVGRDKNVAEGVMASAHTVLQAAEDVVSTRGRVVGVSARNYLAAAKQYYADATKLFAEGEYRPAALAAQNAQAQAQQSVRAAQRDIDDYNDRQRRKNSGGGSGGFLAGMIVNELLSGGRGGYSGGFGGGSFGGGSFGGGGGGGWSGGSTSSGGSF